MTQPKDDLEAVRTIADTLKPFSDEDRERIVRWARERVGMPSEGGGPTTPLPPPTSQDTFQESSSPPPAAKDIGAFIAEKDPKNDSQLAAVVAYYHHFLVPEAERRDWITSDDLLTACRLSGRNRPARPAQTLVNAFSQGLLDRGKQGRYRLNSVGENLVAVVLPDGTGETGPRRTAGRRVAGKRARKTASRKQTKKTTGRKQARPKTRARK